MADSFLKIKISSKGKVLNVKGDNIFTLNNNFGQRLSDKNLLKKDLVAIGGLIKKKITSNILNALDYRGRPVHPLSDATIERKGHSRPLYETGKLSKSVILEVDGKNVIVKMANKKYAKKKVTTQQVAKYLVEGIEGKMPARPFFGITEKDLNTFVKAVIGDGKSKSVFGYKANKGFQSLQNRRAA